jgi:hypothetical protein
MMAKVGEPNAFVFHVRRQFHAPQSIGLPNFVELDRIAAASYLLAALPSVDVVPNPPDAEARIFLEDSALFLLNLSRHGEILLKPKIIKSGTNRHQSSFNEKKPLWTGTLAFG